MYFIIIMFLQLGENERNQWSVTNVMCPKKRGCENVFLFFGFFLKFSQWLFRLFYTHTQSDDLASEYWPKGENLF